ncbi:MAG: hypothetical protein M1818_008458 [Claussenomyces sp. TS43310]|nr:MAG: hypothetical protein M1818_008458 [Claussenomyces sp. TS43310]
MESKQVENQPTDRGENAPGTGSSTQTEELQGAVDSTTKNSLINFKAKKKVHAKSAKICKRLQTKKNKKHVPSSDSSNTSSDEETEDSDDVSTDSSSDSDEESQQAQKRQDKKKKRHARLRNNKKTRKARKKEDTEGSDTDPDVAIDASDVSDIDHSSTAAAIQLQQQVLALNQLHLDTQIRDRLQQLHQTLLAPLPPIPNPRAPAQVIYADSGASTGRHHSRALQTAKPLRALRRGSHGKSLKEKKKRQGKVKPARASKLEFKRVDELWDDEIHNYKLSDTAEDMESSEYDQYLFTVRRTFDGENKYRTTFIDIKSKLLKEALREIMDGTKGVSLAEETPSVDPNFLFLYLEEIRASMRDFKTKIKTEKSKKGIRKQLEAKARHLKVLVRYLDKDYTETKKTLYPMLESGLITFDLLWALFKPNTLAYTPTYSTIDEPRVFKVEYAEKQCNFIKGEWYDIEGKYLEYDGKTWGMGSMDVDVPGFKGARKITSLACYPLQYHKDEEKLREQLIARGKKFVSLQGVHYKYHEGLAFVKKRRQIIKVNISGRIMVDPAIHRRMLPNYPVSTVKPRDPQEDDHSNEMNSEEDCSCQDWSGEETQSDQTEDTEERIKMKTIVIFDKKKKARLVRVPVDEDGEVVTQEELQPLSGESGEVKDVKDKKENPTFTDEEYLIASPVVLGFAFAEKTWLEFTVSGIKDIVWNEGAYDSLVLEQSTKEIVKALVESHTFHPAESIDDVIQGKGKGLVAVLHGPPGTGKTLTAEGISELLKCPLYMVSAGELGTDPPTLEVELQRILDIAHAWGAILLLDEADVFLEARTTHDIHRNALVSIFLRLLEYFQGILFLTTNRVETFDDAFQSRIHIALRYGELNAKAKRSVFKMFIERVRTLEGVETMPFTDEDYSDLTKYNLNGRQIKNTIRTAQALAVNKSELLSMKHVKRVLDVLLRFERDLKGGSGYEDAMRSYH